MALEKRYWSYEQVHALIRHAVVEEQALRQFAPTLIVCIAAGGFVPTRILRSCLKQALGGPQVPIQTIGLQLYDVEGADPAVSPVQRTQWLSYGDGPGQVLLQGQRILLVDEVDDSRKTLACAASELLADAAREQREHEASGSAKPWRPAELGVFVLHNKLRPKLAQLPPQIMERSYFACLEIENSWCVYPWDSEDIYEHTAVAEAAGLPGRKQLDKRQSSGCPAPATNGAATNGHTKQACANGTAAGC